MKHLLMVLLFAGGLLALPLSVEGQIADNETSTNYLAVHCAISGGRMAGDYEEYGRKLARTLGFLAPVQQERVFGFVPQPGATASIPDYNPEFHGSLGATVSGTDDDDAPTSTNSVGGSDPSPTSNPLVDAIGSFNDAINGGDSESDAIIGGEPPATGETEDPLAETKPAPKWINSVLAYLRAIGQPELADTVGSDFWGAVDSGIIDADGNLPTDSNGNELDPEGNIIDPSASGGKGTGKGKGGGLLSGLLNTLFGR